MKSQEIGLETIRMLEANYPEDLAKAIIINGRFTLRDYYWSVI